MIRKILAKVRNDCNLKKLQKDGMKLGKNCTIARNAEIDNSHCWLIEIGDNVNITTKCVILAHDASMHKDLGYTKIGRVKIGNNVFIGAGSIVLPGTEIGDNTVVGAGSVVFGRLDADSVYAGAPVKKIQSKDEFLKKHRTNMETKDLLFDEKWTTRENITPEMKEEMKKRLGDKIGYVK